VRSGGDSIGVPVKTDHVRYLAEKSFSSVFRALAVTSLILMVVLSQDYAISVDEPGQSEYGRHAYAYYRSGFSDHSAMYFGARAAMPEHGVLFDVICAAVEKVSPLSRFHTRHFLNSIIGWLGMVYAARIAGLLGGPQASCAALVLLLLSPRYFGHSMNNPKDIPFATAYAAAIYYLLRTKVEFPFFTPSLLAKTIVAMGAAIEVRAGGLILLAYLWVVLLGRGLLDRVRGIRPWAAIGVSGVIASALAILAGVVGWPWALQKPFVRLFQALSILSDYSFAGNFGVLFDGQYYRADTLPRSYIPTWFVITTPVVVLVLGAVSAPLLAVLKGEARVRLGFVWFACLFPVLYAVCAHPIVYNGMRHLLFVYPPLVVLAAVAFKTLWDEARQRSSLFVCFIAVLAFGLWDPVRFTVANHPLQVVYFNPLIGGIRGAFGRYDVDYWSNSLGQAIEWIDREGGIPPDRAIRVACVKHPGSDLLPSYAEESKRMIFTGVGNRQQADFYLDHVFGDKPALQRQLTTGRILHAVTADGVPMFLVKAGRAWKPR
jgi:hypothetical protein